MNNYDVIVIGGGVVGGMILRELTRYELKVLMVEKNCDVAMGQSKANSGIVHAGFDAETGTNKAKFNVLGANMMQEVCEELGVNYKNNGSLVVAFSKEEIKTLKVLLKRGKKNGVKNLKIISKKELKALEPNISDDALGALYAKSAGIVCPYSLTIASIGNAMDNGADLLVDFDTVKVERDGEYTKLTASDGREVLGKIIINSAGAGAESIANLFGDYSFKTGLRRGEYMLLDRESGNLVNHTLFFTPSAKGKGVLVTQTVDGNILLGPTSVEDGNPIPETTDEGFAFIKEKASQMCKSVPYYNVITSFAGNRAFCDRRDFIIEESKAYKGLINLAGIESPGLTSAPAIAKYVVNEMVLKIKYAYVNHYFIRKRYSIDNLFQKPFKELTIEEKNFVIKKDKNYGKIICRCEGITEGEIRNAIRQNPPARTVDGVKLRTRAGMGRCQGGFCQSRIVEILAEENGVSVLEITKNGKGSEILVEEGK